MPYAPWPREMPPELRDLLPGDDLVDDIGDELPTRERLGRCYGSGFADLVMEEVLPSFPSEHRHHAFGVDEARLLANVYPWFFPRAAEAVASGARVACVPRPAARRHPPGDPLSRPRRVRRVRRRLRRQAGRRWHRRPNGRRRHPPRESIPARTGSSGWRPRADASAPSTTSGGRGGLPCARCWSCRARTWRPTGSSSAAFGWTALRTRPTTRSWSAIPGSGSTASTFRMSFVAPTRA